MYQSHLEDLVKHRVLGPAPELVREVGVGPEKLHSWGPLGDASAAGPGTALQEHSLGPHAEVRAESKSYTD